MLDHIYPVISPTVSVAPFKPKRSIISQLQLHGKEHILNHTYDESLSSCPLVNVSLNAFDTSSSEEHVRYKSRYGCALNFSC